MSSLFSLLRRILIGAIFLAGSFSIFQLVTEQSSARAQLMSWMNSVDRIVLPSLPSSMEPTISADEINVQMMQSHEQVAAIAKSAGLKAIVAKRTGAVLLIDGQLFASNYAAVNSLLASSRLEDVSLVFHEHQSGTSYTLPQVDSQALPASFQNHAYMALGGLRDVVQAHLSLVVLLVLGGVLFLCLNPPTLKLPAWAYFRTRPAYRARPQPVSRYAVRVVLVKNHFALENARIAIGEEHVLASNKDAFAFANGWILAVRDHTVFELLDRLGWSHHGFEMFSESDLRHTDIPGVDRSWQAETPMKRGRPLALVDALSLCGKIAHTQGIPIS